MTPPGHAVPDQSDKGAATNLCYVAAQCCAMLHYITLLHYEGSQCTTYKGQTKCFAMHCYITLHCYITNMDRISRGSYKSGTLLWTHRYIATSFFGMRYNIYRDFHNKCPSKVCWRLLQNICWALHTWGVMYLCICVFVYLCFSS